MVKSVCSAWVQIVALLPITCVMTLGKLISISLLFSYLYNGDENPSLPHRVGMRIKWVHVWHAVSAWNILAIIRALICHLICFSLGFLFLCFMFSDFLWVTWTYFLIPFWFIYNTFSVSLCISLLVFVQSIILSYFTYHNLLVFSQVQDKHITFPILQFRRCSSSILTCFKYHFSNHKLPFLFLIIFKKAKIIFSYYI